MPVKNDRSFPLGWKKKVLGKGERSERERI